MLEERTSELTVQDAIGMLPDGMVTVCRQYGELLLSWKWPKSRVAEILKGKGVEWSGDDATVAGYPICCEYGGLWLFVSIRA